LTVTDIAAAFQTAIAPVLERLDEIEGRFKELAEAKESEPEPVDELTPAASLAALMASVVIGEEKARVDGRKARYDAPKETEAPSKGDTPFPFVNALKSGGDYRKALEQ